ncbi:MAG: hypothetical protein KF765_12160 [Parvibaculaceae bacterium]|nr:hypothetical protein [Parvibaculaceae bacterium]
MHVYTLRAESEAALIAMLEAAQEGKERPFVLDDEDGKTVDAARITFPQPEFDDEEPTGFWLCEVRLIEADAELAAIAETSEGEA